MSAPAVAVLADVAVLAHVAQVPDVADDIVRTLVGLLTTYFALVLGLLVLWAFIVVRLIRRMTVGLDDAGLHALRSVTVAVPLAIDAVDLGLDFLGSPVAWFIANQTPLRPLRGASLWEGLVPGTQLLPTMTLGWWWANHVRRDGPWPGRGEGPPDLLAGAAGAAEPAAEHGTNRADERVIGS